MLVSPACAYTITTIFFFLLKTCSRVLPLGFSYLSATLIHFHYKSKFNIMYTLSLIYSNLILHCFPFSSFEGKCSLSPKTMALFTFTTVNYCLFHLTYRFPYRPRVWPLVRDAGTIVNSIPRLCIFTIWRVEGWQRSMRKPHKLRM